MLRQFTIFEFILPDICYRDASMMLMRKKIAGLRPDQIRQLPKEELDLPVSAAD